MTVTGRDSLTTGARGWKLAFLLDRASDDPACVIGRPEWSWGAELSRSFPGCVAWNDIDEARRSGPYGLILWAPRRTGVRPLAERAASLASLLAPAGSLLLLLPNRLPARAGPRHLLWALKTPAATVWGCRRAIRRAGLSPAAEFLPIPKLSDPEEFVLASSEEAARSLARHGPGLRVAPAIFHDGFLYLTGPDAGGLGRTERALGAALAGRASGPADPVIERFDLRARGALVLVCRGARSGRRLLARTAPAGKALDAVARHAEWTARVREAPGMPDPVVRCVPAPLGAVEVRGQPVYLEDHVSGTIAWRVAARRGRRPAVAQGLYRFLGQFNAGTARTSVLDSDTVDRMLQLWESDVAVGFPGDLARGLERLRAALRRRLEGTSRTLVWAHGDFGFGNALVDADSGALRAVIDWETAHDTELAGVDLLNFLVQGHRMGRHGGFAASLMDVGRGMLGGERLGGTDRAAGAYLNRFGVGPEQLRDALALCCLRWVRREARYADLFARTAGDAEAAVRWAGELLGATTE